MILHILLFCCFSFFQLSPRYLLLLFAVHAIGSIFDPMCCGFQASHQVGEEKAIHPPSGSRTPHHVGTARVRWF
jgi:hypothetical protein